MSTKTPRTSRSRSQTAPTGSIGVPLYRLHTPIDHIDSFTINEDDHNPHESADGTPRTSLTLVNGRDGTLRPIGEHDENEEGHDFEGGHHDQANGGDIEKATTKAEDKKRRTSSSGYRPAERESLSRRLTNSLLRPSSSRPEEKLKVPPEEREWKDDVVTFDTKNDPANAKNWTFKRKVFTTMLFGLTTMCSTFASSVFSSASPYYGREFGLDTQVTILGVSLFVLGYVPGPLVWAPVSEIYGRRASILAPVFIFACFTAGTAVAKDAQTIFITRFFAGVFASAPVTTVGGGLADMWEQKERGTAVVFYSLAVVAGPTIGPIIGGAVSQSYLGWRWTEYISLILTSLILILDFFLLPETYAPVILTRKAASLRQKTHRWALHSKHEERDTSFDYFLHNNLYLPIKMILTEPMVTCITIYNSFTYGILYMLFAAIPIIYEENRGWNSLVGALPFLGVMVGCFVAAGINIAWSTMVFAKHIEANGGKARPELRLPPMMLGSILFPAGFFLAGWTSQPSTNWFPSVLGFSMIGTSFLLIFQSGLNYLIDSYTSRAASAVAANTFLRSIFAVGLPFAAHPMFNHLGIDWGCSLLGFVAVALGGLPFIFYIYGPRLRERSALIEKF